ncbi:MAG: class I tRNA ligase family protein, partial [Haloarculaceae archaeon]
GTDDAGTDDAGTDDAGTEDAGTGEEGADDGTDLVLYVWVDAPIEYVSSTKQYTERVGADSYDWEAAWKIGGETRHGTEWREDWTDESGEILHVIGRDIIQHHAVFWPAMLRGAGYNEPRAIMATGFVGIEGKALSTSRNRAVWADEYLEAGFHPDLFRYYIVTGAGLESDVDFSWDRFAERVNAELVGNLGNFCYRSLLFAERNYGGAPEATMSEEVRERIEQAVESFRDAVADYDLRRLGTVPTDLASFGNEYIQREEPWHLVDEEPERAEQVIGDTVQLVKACAVLAQPVMPEKAAELWSQLGESGSVATVQLDAALEAPAASVQTPEELFTKVEDERVEELTAELRDRVETAAGDDEASGEAQPPGDEDGERDGAGEGKSDGESKGDGEGEGDGAGEGEGDGDGEGDGEGKGDGADAETGAANLEPLLEGRVGYEDFKDLDIRVGRIEVAAPIEGADDLVRLEVDLGVETRQLVAGIRQLHDVDDLPGTKIVVLANLEPAELFGVESNGMLLAAGEDADLLTTHGDAEPGTKIR